MIGLTKTAALEYADDRIRVNAVCPGFIRTAMTAETQRERAEQITSRTPMGRFGEPDEIAEIVVIVTRRLTFNEPAYRTRDGEVRTRRHD